MIVGGSVTYSSGGSSACSVLVVKSKVPATRALVMAGARACFNWLVEEQPGGTLVRTTNLPQYES